MVNLASSNPSPQTGLADLIGSLSRHTGLIAQLTRREVLGRYRGSALGFLWSFLNPLLMLVVYTFIFSVVFQQRWPGVQSASRVDFAMVLFAGMIVFGIFNETVSRAPNLIVSQPNYVKKVVFPLEVMPWVSLGGALFHALVSLALLIALVLIVHGNVQPTVVFFPLVLLPLLMLCTGLGWFLSSLGVFLRDIGQIVGVLTTALMFVSPLFYPVSALPERFRFLGTLNPLAFPIEQARDVIIFGRMPDWSGLAAHLVVGLAVMWLGFAWFQRTRRGFADVV